MNTLGTIAISAISGAAAAGMVAVSFVELQPTTPGTAQTGHLNITGYALADRVGLNTSPTLARVQINETGGLQGLRSITGTGVAVYGQSNAATGLGAGGYFTSSSAGGRALVAEQYSTSGNTVGGLFFSRSTSGTAAYGRAIAVTGANTGVLGETLSPGGAGVRALNSSSDGTALFAKCAGTTDGTAAIFGKNTATSAWGRAAHFQGGGDNGDGIFIECDGASQDFTFAMKSRANGAHSRAVDAAATESTGTNYGVYGSTASGTNGFGVYSNGNFGASGTKSLVIDNPSDPANSILKQYCAEGAEPLLIYSGTVKLNSSGSAWVSLPSYYESIATNARYSLTAVGASMPSLYVATKVQAGKFQIAGGVANGEVSWTIYATRNDPWVKTYGAQTVVPKSAEERGTYITPQLYGRKASYKMGMQPEERNKLRKLEAQGTK